jgi:hypothetical protein
MDNRSTFLYHFYGDRGGTQKDRLSIPIGHGVLFILDNAGAGKSTSAVKLRMKGSCVETQDDLVESKLPRKSSLSLK